MPHPDGECLLRKPGASNLNLDLAAILSKVEARHMYPYIDIGPAHLGTFGLLLWLAAVAATYVLHRNFVPQQCGRRRAQRRRTGRGLRHCRRKALA